MEQQDYLMKQVEQMGLVLEKILSKLLNLKDKGTISMETVNHIFTEELDFDINKLITVEDDNQVDALKNQFDTKSLEKLADILLFAAENTNSNEYAQLYKQSLKIYKYVEESGDTYSFERNFKIDKLKFYLKQKNNVN
jgi:hypothetical protein